MNPSLSHVRIVEDYEEGFLFVAAKAPFALRVGRNMVDQSPDVSRFVHLCGARGGSVEGSCSMTERAILTEREGFDICERATNPRVVSLYELLGEGDLGSPDELASV